MVKNSFTIFEVILSVSILAIIISGFSNSTYYDNNDELFQLLNDLENKFDSKDYSSLNLSNETITIIKNHNQNIDINVKKYQFIDDNIKVYKYEK